MVEWRSEEINYSQDVTAMFQGKTVSSAFSFWSLYLEMARNENSCMTQGTLTLAAPQRLKSRIIPFGGTDQASWGVQAKILLVLIGKLMSFC